MLLNAEAVKSILDRVTIGTTGRADAADLVVAEANERIHKLVEETAVQAWVAHECVNQNVMDWVSAQQEDFMLKIVTEWISSHKVQDVKHLFGEHAMMEEVNSITVILWQLVVPMAQRVVALKGCQRNTGHQGEW